MQPSVSVSHPPLPAAAAADEPTGDGAEKRFVNKKLPSAPSVGTWFDKMKAEHEAQEQAKVVSGSVLRALDDAQLAAFISSLSMQLADPEQFTRTLIQRLGEATQLKVPPPRL